MHIAFLPYDRQIAAFVGKYDAIGRTYLRHTRRVCLTGVSLVVVFGGN
jgi:hypothetical protein